MADSNTENSPQNLVQVFRALADPTRLAIVRVLMQEGPVSQKRLIFKLGRPQPSVSRHLLFLWNAGIVTVRRSGRFSFWALSQLPHEALDLVDSLGVSRSQSASASERSTQATAHHAF